jgi:hypothetical protein
VVLIRVVCSNQSGNSLSPDELRLKGSPPTVGLLRIGSGYGRRAAVVKIRSAEAL